MYPSTIKQSDLNRIRSRSHPQLKFASHPSALYQLEGGKIQVANQMLLKEINKDWKSEGRIHSSVGRKNVSRSARSTSSFQSNFSSRSMPNIRNVPAFTPASRMKNTLVIGPPKIGIFRPRPSAPTTFRRMYERGDIPVTLHHDHRGHSLRWKVDLDKIDYHHYLPLFFDGLRETKHPYDFFARAGVTDLLARGGERIVAVIPQLILPLKHALNTREPRVICTVLQVMQELVASSPHVGEALVPYYRQLLPTLNLFKNKNINLGDEIDYSQRRQENLGDLIQNTLELLERRGGRDAYINIKYMVPTYQSCVN